MVNKVFCHALWVLTSLVAIGQALKCHYCISTGSWKSCHTDLKTIHCMDDTLDACIIMYARNKYNKHDEGFAKGCAKTCNKNEIPGCQHGGSLDCKIQCCTTDYCNAGFISLSAASTSTPKPSNAPTTRDNIKITLAGVVLVTMLQYMHRDIFN